MLIFVYVESEQPILVTTGVYSHISAQQNNEMRDKLQAWLTTWIDQWMPEITQDFTDEQVSQLVKGKLYDIALGKEPTDIRHLTTEMVRRTEIKVNRVMQEAKKRNEASAKIHPLKAVEQADFAADQEILNEQARQQQRIADELRDIKEEDGGTYRSSASNLPSESFHVK